VKAATPKQAQPEKPKGPNAPPPCNGSAGRHGADLATSRAGFLDLRRRRSPMLKTPIIFAGIVVSAFSASALAEPRASIPDYDIKAFCQNPDNRKFTLEPMCVNEQFLAKQAVIDLWSKVSAAGQHKCSDTVDRFGSYEILANCLYAQARLEGTMQEQ
jgi:hypothetical protein